MAKLYNEKKYLDFANLYAKYTGQELSAQEKGYIKAYQDQYANRKVVPQFVLSQSYDDQYYLEVGVYHYTSTPLEDIHSDSIIIESGNFKANNKDEFRKIVEKEIITMNDYARMFEDHPERFKGIEKLKFK